MIPSGLSKMDLLTYEVYSEFDFDFRHLFDGLHLTAAQMGTFSVEGINIEDL